MSDNSFSCHEHHVILCIAPTCPYCLTVRQPGLMSEMIYSNKLTMGTNLMSYQSEFVLVGCYNSPSGC